MVSRVFVSTLTSEWANDGRKTLLCLTPAAQAKTENGWFCFTLVLKLFQSAFFQVRKKKDPKRFNAA